MRKLNKVTKVKNDTIETYNRCSYACSCRAQGCSCSWNPNASDTTRGNNNYNANYSTFNGTYRK